jgi:hypothetical protein
MLSLGKIEFSPEEDPHVVADCVKVSLYSHSKILILHVCYSTMKAKLFFLSVFFHAILQYVLRELPSSPVPASCCNALLEACRKSVNQLFVYHLLFIHCLLAYL